MTSIPTYCIAKHGNGCCGGFSPRFPCPLVHSQAVQSSLKNTALFTLNTLIIQFATQYVNKAKARPYRTRLRQTQKEIHNFTICEPKQKGVGGDMPLSARKNNKPRKTKRKKKGYEKTNTKMP